MRQAVERLLPETRIGRQYERKALRVRQFAGVAHFQPLDPFRLASLVRLRVLTVDDVSMLSDQARAQLSSVDSEGWSGAASPPLPDGSRIIVINQKQSRTRQAATLMEEICHILLGHKPDNIVDGRDYDRRKEAEAYGVGAAALLPYHVIYEALKRRESERAIALHYGVSQQLVRYRRQIVGLWKPKAIEASHGLH